MIRKLYFTSNYSAQKEANLTDVYVTFEYDTATKQLFAVDKFRNQSPKKLKIGTLDENGGKLNIVITGDIGGAVYTAGDGIAISDDNVISLTGQPDLSNYITISQINENYLTKDDIINDFYTKNEVEETIISNISGKADITNIEANFTATSTWINDTFETKDNSTSNYNQILSNLNQLETTLQTTSATITASIPTKVSQLDNDVPYISTHQSLDDYATQSWVENNFLSTVAGEYITEEELATELSSYAKSENVSLAIQLAVETVSGTLTSQIIEVDERVAAIENNYTTSGFVTEQVNALADGQVATNTASIETISADYLKAADIAEMATTGYVVGAVAINTASINDVSDRVTTIENNYLTSSAIAQMATTGYVAGVVNDLTNGTLDTLINGTVATNTNNINIVSGKVDNIIADYTTSSYVTEQVNTLANGQVTTNTNNIINISGRITTIEADYLKAADIAEMATTGYVDGAVATVSNRVDSVIANYTTSAQVSSIVEGYGYITGIENNALISDVETASSNAVSVATGWVNDQGYLTDHQSLDDYYKKTEVDTISSALSTTVANADYQNATQVSGIIEGYDYATNTSAISISNRVGTIEADYLKAASITEMATTSYVTGKVNDLATGSVATNTANISEVSGKVNGVIADYTTSAQVNSIIEGYGYITGIQNNALISDVQTASGNAVNVATGWVSNQNYLTDHQTFTGADGIKVENNVISISGQVGKTYTPGDGIKIDQHNEISFSGHIPTLVSELTNDLGFITVGSVENRQKIMDLSGETVKDVITFNPYYHIYKTYYTGGEVTLNDVIFNDYTIENDVVTTFEQWITFDQPVTTVMNGNNILVGALPGSLDETKTHVFVRRIFKHNGTIKQCISYAYYF